LIKLKGRLISLALFSLLLNRFYSAKEYMSEICRSVPRRRTVPGGSGLPPICLVRPKII